MTLKDANIVSFLFDCKEREVKLKICVDLKTIYFVTDGKIYERAVAKESYYKMS